MKDEIFFIIKNASNEELTNAILSSYTTIENEYFRSRWQSCELNSGHFVEAIRRYLDFKFVGNYKPLNESLGSFNQAALNKYESNSGIEEYRIIIPRILYSIYCVRNKRGVGHLSSLNPNHQDATYILNSVKWIIAEIIRIESSKSPDETIRIIEKITQRSIELIWDSGTAKRILDTKISMKDQILIYLYDESPQTTENLQKYTEAQNSTYFKKVLKELHRGRYLELNEELSECSISPTGEHKAEKVIADYMKRKSL